MRHYVCYHCAFKIVARERPKKCPACGKVSTDSGMSRLLKQFATEAKRGC